MTKTNTMEVIEGKRFDLMYKIYQLKQLLGDDMFDSETIKMITDQISEVEKKLKALSDKK
jgi:hypothetical protein